MNPPEPCEDPELLALAAWLEATPPPGPLALGPGLAVEDPALCWACHRERLALGVRGRDARGVLLLLRRLKEVMTR